MKIVLPHYSGDQWLLLKNLAWMKELDAHIDRDCVLACDDRTDPKEALAQAKTLFRNVDLCQYARAHHGGKLMEAWPWQQNNSFARTCEYMAHQKEPWFWCETDCTPLAPGWWKTLEDEYTKGGKPFGGHWNADMKVFNGVAIYPRNVALHSPKCLLAALYVDEKNVRQTPWDALASSEIYPKMHVMNNVMQHLWCLPGQSTEQAPTFPDIASVEKFIRPGMVLFHRCKDGSLLDRMREIRAGKASVQLRGIDKVHQAKEIPKTDIFIVSFKRDLEFTMYCLRSIEKFAQGFNQVVLLVPTTDWDQFATAIPKHVSPNFPIQLKSFEEAPGKGMIHHEAMVCSADQFCDGDFILHMDSDCIFKEPVTPLDYFVEGKPVMLKERFDRLEQNCRYWQEAVRKALGFKPEYETMRRHPAIHPRWLYQKVRAAVGLHTKRKFVDYVLSCQNHFPQGFAEFPTLGAWALRYSPDSHHWVDVEKEAPPHDKLRQFWSHDPKGVDMVWPAEQRTVREIMNDILK